LVAKLESIEGDQNVHGDQNEQENLNSCTIKLTELVALTFDGIFVPFASLQVINFVSWLIGSP
jgi:hypothetical protein